MTLPHDPTPGETDELKRRVGKHGFWYHRIALPGGVVTPGVSPLSAEAYGVPHDLGGKRVLDVGAWDGYWTFEALKRGARQVLAIDDFSDFMGFLSTADRKGWETFDLCRDAFGYDASRCSRQELSVYDVTEQLAGRFDVVFMFGTLYHLRHPLLALDRLSAVCDCEIYVESQILNDFSPYRGGFGKGYGNDLVMEFYPDDQLAGNASNWWAPTLECLAQMVRAAGFADVKAWKLLDNPTELGFCRGFVRGTKTSA